MGTKCNFPQREAVERNLLDAGCECEKTQQFLQLLDEGRVQELIRMLRCQRCRMMEVLHKEQQKVDCLDYLIYQLKKCEDNCDTGCSQSETGRD